MLTNKVTEPATELVSVGLFFTLRIEAISEIFCVSAKPGLSPSGATLIFT